MFKFRMVVLVWSKLVGDEAAYSASCVQTFSGSKRDALPDGAARQCALLQRERERDAMPEASQQVPRLEDTARLYGKSRRSSQADGRQ